MFISLIMIFGGSISSPTNIPDGLSYWKNCAPMQIVGIELVRDAFIAACLGRKAPKTDNLLWMTSSVPLIFWSICFTSEAPFVVRGGDAICGGVPFLTLIQAYLSFLAGQALYWHLITASKIFNWTNIDVLILSGWKHQKDPAAEHGGSMAFVFVLF